MFSGVGRLGLRAVFGGPSFSVLSLFANGEQGGWYDPSDLTTMFQDAAGTTAAALESPVGLVLDKSKGLVLGSELVTNGDFSSLTGWNLGPNVTIANGSLSFGGTLFTSAASNTGDSPVAGKVYFYRLELTAVNGGVKFTWGNTNSPLFTTAGVKTGYIVASNTSRVVIYGAETGSATATIESISVKEIPGNHLSQSTSTARPVLSARVNAFAYSEDFSNAVWVRMGLTSVTTNAVTAPNGTQTADAITEAATTEEHGLYQIVSTPTGEELLVVNVKPNLRTRFIIRVNISGTWRNANFVLTGSGSVGTKTGFTDATITPLSDGWYKCTATFSNRTNTAAVVAASTADEVNIYLGSTSSPALYIWGADLRPANAGVGLPAYQRVGASTDYDATGFPYYLRWDGTDDGMASGSIDFSGTDKLAAFAGVRKLSDTVSIVAELSFNIANNTGSFYLATGADPTPSGKYSSGSRGTAVLAANQAAESQTGNAPQTAVMAATHDISGDLSTLNVNGTAATSGTGDKGAGNFGNYPLYVGSRNNASLRFNGNLYSLIVVGRALTAAEIAATETWVNGKTKAF